MGRHRAVDAKLLKTALAKLDGHLAERAHLIVGGGAAMLLAYGHSLATQDVDAFAARGGLRIADLDSLARKVAAELDIEPDWLNAHFESFAHVLPGDYAKRLQNVFDGKWLRVDVLGAEDLLVMKCFAGRDKDLGHARKLIRLAKDLDVVERRIAELVDKRIPGAEKAADYFDDLRDEAGL